jgi:hypothetical protein
VYNAVFILFLRLLQCRKAMRYATLNSWRICRNIHAVNNCKLPEDISWYWARNLITQSIASVCELHLQLVSDYRHMRSVSCSRFAQWESRFTALHSHWNYGIKEPQLAHSSQPSDPVARPHCCNQYLYSIQHDELDPEQTVPVTFFFRESLVLFERIRNTTGAEEQNVQILYTKLYSML